MLFRSKDYANKSLSMPDREDRKEDKNSKKYNLRMAEYVYHEFCRGGTYVRSDWYDTVSRNRSYAEGRQDETKYMDAFYGKADTNNVIETLTNAGTRKSSRKAYNNLNFDIQSPAPRYMDAIVGKLKKLVNRVSVDALDAKSGARREELKWGTYVDGKFREEFQSLSQIMQLPQQDVGYTPRNIEELNLYEAEGGFKLAYERLMETLLKYGFNVSNWEENTVERVITDLVTSGFAAVEDCYDKYTGQVKCNYIDAEYVGVQYTKEDAYRNPDYGFYVKMVKLSDLFKRGLSEEKLKNVAKTFEGVYGNPKGDDWNKYNKNKVDYSVYDRYSVPVFVVKWIDVEFKREKQYKNRQGKNRTKEVDYKYKPKERDKMLETRMKTVREVYWVIGTDLVYDYGKCEFQARDGMSDPVLPIHMVKVTGRPIIPRLIPSLDQYQMAWLRLQQGISMAAMNGFAINMDAISNLQMNGQKFPPKEVLRFWRQTGTLFFKPTEVTGRMNPGSQIRPIEQLPGGAGAVIAESLQVMDAAMLQIERLTGINPVSVGDAPSAGVGKAVTEYSIMGTNEVLQGVLDQVNTLKSDVARAMTLRFQHVVQADPRARKTYTDVIGENSVELLKISDGGDIKYGIRTHARPTDQDIAELKELIGLSLKNGRDGKVGITEADAVRFFEMINSGASLKLVTLMLDFANRKAQEEMEARNMRAQQMNTQQAQVMEQQKAQQESQARLEEAQANIAVANAKSRGQILEKAVAEGILNWERAMEMFGNAPMTQQPQQPQEQVVADDGGRVVPMQEDAV